MPKNFYEIFRAGKYPQGEFSDSDIQMIADNYDPEFLQAAITIDHAKKGPAFGYVDQVKAEGGKLLATFKNVVDDVKTAVKNKQFQRHSAEIFRDLEGKGPYLKGVSLLGAQVPQVKGLKPIEFSEEIAAAESELIEFEEPLEAVQMNQDESVDAVKFAQMKADLNRERREKANLQRQLTEKDDEVATFRQKYETQEFASKKAGFLSFLDEQIDGGRLAPKQKDQAVALFEEMAPVVSEEAEKNLIELFKEFIKSYPDAMKKLFESPEGEETDDETPSGDAIREFRDEQATKGNVMSFSQAQAELKKQKKSTTKN